MGSLLVHSCCETDFEVTRPADPTPIVYCVLNQAGPVQKLRITRSYVSINGSIPPHIDSILYKPAIPAALEQMTGDRVEVRALFNPVMVEKDSGFFPNNEHWTYETNMTVYPGKEYRLIIYLDDYERIIYSRCQSVDRFIITNPVYPELREIHLQTEHNPQFLWTRSNHAGIYQLGYTLHYEEIIAENSWEKEIDIPLRFTFQSENIGNLYSQSINSTLFYQKLAGLMPSDPTIFRKFLSIDAFVVSGGAELAYLVQLQSAGQTFSLMEYSNIMNGIGIFSSSITERINGFKLTDQTIDSLAYGQYTYDLNFADRTGTRQGGGK